MVTPSEGALGGIDFSEEQRRELAEKSRAKEVNFTFGSEKRREVTRLVHEKMLGRMGKAKQAARKMAMEKRERKKKMLGRGVMVGTERTPRRRRHRRLR